MVLGAQETRGPEEVRWIFFFLGMALELQNNAYRVDFAPLHVVLVCAESPQFQQMFSTPSYFLFRFLLFLLLPVFLFLPFFFLACFLFFFVFLPPSTGLSVLCSSQVVPVQSHLDGHADSVVNVLHAACEPSAAACGMQ